MASFSFKGILAGGSAEHPTMMGTIANTATGITLIDHGNDVVRHYDATGSGLATAGGTLSLGGRVSFSHFGESVSLSGRVIDAVLAGTAAGDHGSDRAYLSTLESQATAATLAGATVNGTDFLFVASQNGAGLAAYAVTNSGNTLTFAGSVTDTPGSYAAQISAMTTVEVSGTTYLLAGSSSEHGVTAYRVSGTGTLTEVDSFGRGESLPLQSVASMDSVTIDGTAFVVVASAGSSSLTVLRMQPDGTLAPAEHVVDSLDTRFSGVSALDVVDLGGGRCLVIAGGNDGGLTAYTLLPDGHLSPFQVIEGSTQAGLDRISGIGTNLTGSRLDLFVTTEGAPGVAQFTLDVSGFGDLAQAGVGTFTGTGAGDLIVAGSEPANLYGGAGDDIIVDGAGRDRLYGEAGADTFVLIGGDLERDRIFDYEIGIDTIDLSGWAMCYGTAWLTVQALSNGALRVTHGQDSLDIFSAGGQPLTEADFARITFTFSSSYAVERAPLEMAPETTGSDVFGTLDNDLLTGTAGNDDMHAGGGDDMMISGGGTDNFWGGSGMDIVSYAGTGPGLVVNLSNSGLNAGAAAGSLFYSIEGLIGCAHADHLTGTAEANRLEGGAGHDWLDGLEGDDILIGGDGNDSILGRAGNDYIDGGAGDDNLPGAEGDDEIHGGHGNDQIGGGDGNDLLFGDDGNDWIGGGSGNDRIEGGAGHDSISATYGDDFLFGNSGKDHIAAGPGADYISGGSDDDTIGGGAGRDEIHGGVGNDTVGAGDGDDRVWGDHGNDVLNGGAGNDMIDGGDGNDRINGGAGNDILIGGLGADTFVFATHDAGEYDIITDFDATGVDLIQIAGVAGGSNSARFAALGAAQDGSDVLFSHAGHSIRLEDVSLADLSHSDFLFV
ncbi:calcium-binding protein [Vannielia litorea]|uniref:Ca2+-binding protein, RTX toxin-related n=1 Tax=Vannielia litorea TaxID=1217970 RepID=A0A1N6HN03_9RHOB|nr:calcium-binding protein [Vannielia litorea]SIO21142.1 Ca2+-binding protein, RTX toxin-related [Vannielia litorea]